MFSKRRCIKILLVAIIFFLKFELISQELQQRELNVLSEKYASKSFPLLRELLSIPNNSQNKNEILNNLIWCEYSFQKRNFKTLRIETSGAPLLLAEKANDNAAKTVLIYLQVDGQPTDSSKWSQSNAYQPVLKKKNTANQWEELPWDAISRYTDEWRIFARSASDAKGPIAMFLTAIDAMREKQLNPNYNLKVIMDFEEELGSPHIAEAVMNNAKLLKADMLLIFDGPRHIKNLPTLIFGARGIATVSITTYGPVSHQHSGHFGNYAPNPALRLSRLLASMKNEDGKVTIPGFYGGIRIDENTRRILRTVPDDEKEFKEKLQLGGVDKVGMNYQEAMQYPSLNIRGLQSGWIDENARTIVPAWAKAELDIRLVPESNPMTLIKLLKHHIKNQGFYLTDTIPNKIERIGNNKVATLTYKLAYNSFRTDFNSEPGIFLKKAIYRAFGNYPIMIRMTGGSVPISPFVKTLNIPAVIVPTVNSDNNQHGPNENLRLGNYKEGIKTMIAILSEPL